MEAAALRMCPGCSSRMGRVFAKAIELDFCQFCGGVWCDRGEVLKVTGHAEAVTEGSQARLKCPDCGTALRRGSLSGNVVDQCDRCSGTYVPPDTLDRLAGEHVGMLAIPEEGQRHDVEFCCAGCKERFPMDQAITTYRGLACRNCYGMMDNVPGSGVNGPGYTTVDFYAEVGRQRALTADPTQTLGPARSDPLELREREVMLEREATPLQRATEMTVKLVAFVAKCFVPF